MPSFLGIHTVAGLCRENTQNAHCRHFLIVWLFRGFVDAMEVQGMLPVHGGRWGSQPFGGSYVPMVVGFVDGHFEVWARFQGFARGRGCFLSNRDG
jgi:hypothetical protein